MQKNIKKIFVSSLIALLFVQMIYVSVEPTIATAATAPDTAIISLNVDAGISITDGANATMSTMSSGVNTSIGTSAWTVKTNNNTGYKLDVKASASPALVSGGGSFADYTETSAGVPETWTLAASTKEFGFSGYGTDVSTGTYGTGATCGSGSTIPGTMKYQGFSTTDQTLATVGSATPYAGVVTNICFAAGQNGVFAPSGTYTATITGTATTL